MRFYRAMAIGIIGIWAVAYGSFAWLDGRIGFVPSLAWGADVSKVEDHVSKVDDKVVLVNLRLDHLDRRLKDIQTLQLMNTVADRVKAVCQAHRANNQSDLDSANADLRQILDVYEEVSQREYHIPDCKTVLVGN